MLVSDRQTYIKLQANYLRNEHGLFGRHSSLPGQGRRLIDTFAVDQVTKCPLIAAVEVVRTTLSLQADLKTDYRLTRAAGTRHS